ncbi:hypothetical protein K440DRAFT_611192, partial [Wilcoxina mikolae CBS 423.85]
MLSRRSWTPSSATAESIFRTTAAAGVPSFISFFSSCCFCCCCCCSGSLETLATA